MDLNILGANGIVGAAMPLGTGAALASKLRGTDQVTVSFFGDGGSNQGVFHEAMNLASVWQLPMIFVCENNQYALSTSYRNATSVPQISRRAAGYDMPGITVDGNDAVEVCLVVREAVERARAGEGPTLIEAMTYRHGGHSRADPATYRPDGELEAWLARDPVPLYRQRLLDFGIGEDVVTAMEDETITAVDEATETAKASPAPSTGVTETEVWADGGSSWRN
jgi:pyruvate dehydrogenase E1 component alpha subunit